MYLTRSMTSGLRPDVPGVPPYLRYPGFLHPCNSFRTGLSLDKENSYSINNNNTSPEIQNLIETELNFSTKDLTETEINYLTEVIKTYLTEENITDQNNSEDFYCPICITGKLTSAFNQINCRNCRIPIRNHFSNLKEFSSKIGEILDFHHKNECLDRISFFVENGVMVGFCDFCGLRAELR